MSARHLKREWLPDADAFRRLLVWLDEGGDSGGERYVEMRRRLVAYFDRRGARTPDDLADETLNRVARRLVETGAIDDAAPAKFCYITAKFVLLEASRQANRETAGVRAAVAGGAALAVSTVSDAAADEREDLLDRLEQCLAMVKPADRELILEYYGGRTGTAIARRKGLAERLGLTANALAIRACRIRERLERCVQRRDARR